MLCKGEEVLGQKKVGEHMKIMAATESTNGITRNLSPQNCFPELQILGSNSGKQFWEAIQELLRELLQFEEVRNNGNY